MRSDFSGQMNTGSIGINKLARELEVRAKAVIDYLPEIGVTEKKTHSSRISLLAAEKVRKHFRELAEAESELDATRQRRQIRRQQAASVRIGRV